MERTIEREEIVKKPIFFENNRVYRVYLGGKGFDGFLPDAEDGIFPEEWVASKVRAINPRYFGPRDGVSVVKGTDIFLDDLLEEFPEETLGNRKYDCLVKFLDSAIRLPVQVHPTKEFSKKHFDSEYGKTEAWLVIATREDPKLYFGFNKKIDKETLSDLEERSEEDRDAMTTVLTCVTPKVGDVYLITAGLIHAIGEGCTVIEIQEPTDFTIQPERWCGDYHISYKEEYIGLDKSTALDCFDFDLYGERALNMAKKTPKTVFSENGVLKESLISYADTPCFALNRFTLRDSSMPIGPGPAVYVVVDGNGTVGDRPIKKGDYFFLPYAAAGTEISGEIVFVECLPSKQD
ncbi:MAG: class I mannose-6-phosphate isomerase [Clostridia bacterium]|nr:class I mannose-6-phosphate isomerase [Clostridia bacterium]